jgi:hypothetical protein
MILSSIDPINEGKFKMFYPELTIITALMASKLVLRLC